MDILDARAMNKPISDKKDPRFENQLGQGGKYQQV